MYIMFPKRIRYLEIMEGSSVSMETTDLSIYVFKMLANALLIGKAFRKDASCQFTASISVCLQIHFNLILLSI